MLHTLAFLLGHLFTFVAGALVALALRRYVPLATAFFTKFGL